MYTANPLPDVCQLFLIWMIVYFNSSITLYGQMQFKVTDY